MGADDGVTWPAYFSSTAARAARSWSASQRRGIEVPPVREVRVHRRENLRRVRDRPLELGRASGRSPPRSPPSRSRSGRAPQIESGWIDAMRRGDLGAEAVPGDDRRRPAGVDAPAVGNEHGQRVEGKRLQVVARARRIGQAVPAQVDRDDARRLPRGGVRPAPSPRPCAPSPWISTSGGSSADGPASAVRPNRGNGSGRRCRSVTTSDSGSPSRAARGGTLDRIGTWSSGAAASRAAIRAGASRCASPRSASRFEELVATRPRRPAPRRAAPARERGRRDRGRAHARSAERSGLRPRTTRSTACTRACPASTTAPTGPVPNKITIFRLPLEEDYPDPDELARRSSERSSTRSATTPASTITGSRARLDCRLAEAALTGPMTCALRK